MKIFYKSLRLVIGCVILSTTFSSAQSISTIKTEFAFPNSYDGMIASPSIQLEFNKHGWSIGPTLLFSYGDQIEQRDGFKLTGIHLGYDNYLHGREANFNLFHSFDFYFQRIKDEQASQYFDTSINSFQPFKIEQTDNVIQLFANFGVLIKLSERLELSQIIGLGVNGTFRYTTSPFDDFKDSFFAQDWLVKTGLSYRLK